MQACFPRFRVFALVLVAGLSLKAATQGQEQPAEQPSKTAAALPSVPEGVEVLARGPVHEAFATLTTEPAPTKPVSKPPPKTLEELPPAEKPEGNVIWIGGYWAWDDERNDFLWVSGTWRAPPPGKRWVAGYWRAEGQQSRWVPGFWAAADKQEAAAQQVTYLPEPPAPPGMAPPGTPPTPESFYVPGNWIWHDAGTTSVGGVLTWRDAGYAWSAGYWARVQPGYVWVPAHFRWTPGGYVFIPGYWDFVVAQRGVLYAPVVVHEVVVGPRFIYTPAYAVRDTIVIDALFVRPSYCHYYFGDYYGPVYRELGYESCVVYSRRRYDALFAYERYAHRHDPRWEAVQVEVCLARHAGRAPCPPRTLAQQNIIVQQNITNVTNVNVVNKTTNVNRTTVNQSQVLVPSAQLAAAKGVRTVALDTTARAQAKEQSQAIQQVALQRHQVEATPPAGKPIQPRAVTLQVPPPQPLVSRPAPAGTATPAAVASKQLPLPTTGPTHSASGSPLARPPSSALEGPAKTGTLAAVANSPRLQPPVAAARPAGPPLPRQPIPQGSYPFTLRPTQQPVSASPWQRPSAPGFMANPPGQFQRPFLTLQPQPRPAPTQNKPEKSEKRPPAGEQKPNETAK